VAYLIPGQAGQSRTGPDMSGCRTRTDGHHPIRVSGLSGVVDTQTGRIK
jgi:hypothetical protein